MDNQVNLKFLVANERYSILKNVVGKNMANMTK